MTAIDTSFDTSHETQSGASRSGPRFVQTLGDMAAMSWPIMLGAAVMALLHTGQAGLLGHLEDRQPLYLLSMLQPWYLLFFAFLEALAITGQVFSAKSKSMWPRGGVKIAMIFLSILGVALLAGLLGLVQLGQGLLVTRFGLVDQAVFDIQEPVIALLVDAPEIREATHAMLRLLLPTYVLVAFVVFAHVILENLGRGIRVFVWTILLEAGTVYALLVYGTDIAMALWILIGSAVIYGAVFALEYALMTAAQRRKPAAAAPNPGAQTA